MYVQKIPGVIIIIFPIIIYLLFSIVILSHVTTGTEEKEE